MTTDFEKHLAEMFTRDYTPEPPPPTAIELLDKLSKHISRVRALTEQEEPGPTQITVSQEFVAEIRGLLRREGQTAREQRTSATYQLYDQGCPAETFEIADTAIAAARSLPDDHDARVVQVVRDGTYESRTEIYPTLGPTHGSYGH